ncbi:hypothetical protein OOZ63_18035 [Paucibacter sp. PLA-PC-4]|uniref:hypothetical protein n=1 Tax=Paucibacter sp. PLA-PC-4 TaxID=2993655 RepID=UPI00224B483A|nr:hypothetical protein [Paucibacter sp. PLA-PC-4]MCX2863732.1 hypothetical protein [Paucibacter sp. PLA-PC-4]
MICKQCGTLHDGSHNLPGNGWIEFVLWLAWLVPGLIYSIWRRSKKKPACRSCGNRELIAVESPVGSKLLREHYPDGTPMSGPSPASQRPPTAAAKVIDWTARVLVWGLLAFIAAGLLVAVVFGR